MAVRPLLTTVPPVAVQITVESALPVMLAVKLRDAAAPSVAVSGVMLTTIGGTVIVADTVLLESATLVAVSV